MRKDRDKLGNSLKSWNILYFIHVLFKQITGMKLTLPVDVWKELYKFLLSVLNQKVVMNQT